MAQYTPITKEAARRLYDGGKHILIGGHDKDGNGQWFTSYQLEPMAREMFRIDPRVHVSFNGLVKAFQGKFCRGYSNPRIRRVEFQPIEAVQAE